MCSRAGEETGATNYFHRACNYRLPLPHAHRCLPPTAAYRLLLPTAHRCLPPTAAYRPPLPTAYRCLPPTAAYRLPLPTAHRCLPPTAAYRLPLPTAYLWSNDSLRCLGCNRRHECSTLALMAEALAQGKLPFSEVVSAEAATKPGQSRETLRTFCSGLQWEVN